VSDWNEGQYFTHGFTLRSELSASLREAVHQAPSVPESVAPRIKPSAPIAVQAATDWKGRPGYRWVCRACLPERATGLHLFNRWTDHVRRGHPDEHPWVRAMRAGLRHLHTKHGRCSCLAGGR